MRISKLELQNFRQFRGVQTLEFCGASPADPQNVTVVCGENGRGKTGLYRAVMYCLYGQRDLDQDRNFARDGKASDTEGLYLVNLAALEAAARDQRGVAAHVRMSFTHDNWAYEMTRSLYGILGSDGGVLEEERGVELAITDGSGNTEILGTADQERIHRETNRILDARVKDYFLFDGERIERLTKVTEQQKKEVAQGIKNLLRIDELFTVEKAVQNLDNKLTKELQKVSTGDYKKKLQEKEQLTEKQMRLDEAIERIEGEIETAGAQVARLDRELEQFRENRDLLLRRKDLERYRDGLLAGIDDVREQMRKFTSHASVLLAKDAIDQVYVDIDQKRARGQVPPDIKKELIEKLLQEMKCICGREIEPESMEYHLLKAWDREVPTAESQRDIIGLFGDVGRAAEHVENKGTELIELLQKRGELDEKLDRADLQLEELSKQLSRVPDTDLASKNQARENAVKKIAILEQDRDRKKDDLQGTNEKLSRVERELSTLEKESQEHRRLSSQRELAMRSKGAVKRIIHQFVQEMRQELEDKANGSFRRLLDADGQTTLKGIRVKEDYTLEVVDWKDRPFLANISAGQRQIVSLCFITALAQVAGGSAVLEVPLFMDTPFGRLSYEHRDNLLREIPEVTPQWVLLATETELSEKEQSHLSGSGRWGKFYRLRAGGEGVTNIVEEPVVQLQGLG